MQYPKFWRILKIGISTIQVYASYLWFCHVLAMQELNRTSFCSLKYSCGTHISLNLAVLPKMLLFNSCDNSVLCGLLKKWANCNRKSYIFNSQKIWITAYKRAPQNKNVTFNVNIWSSDHLFHIWPCFNHLLAKKYLCWWLKGILFFRVLATWNI